MLKFRLFHRKSVLSEAEQNALSIMDVPLAQFPDVAARAELIRRARAGADVYAYRPAHQLQWVVWIRTANPANEMRWFPSEWSLWWHHAGEPRP
jgi:hypothetical protein